MVQTPPSICARVPKKISKRAKTNRTTVKRREARTHRALFRRERLRGRGAGAGPGGTEDGGAALGAVWTEVSLIGGSSASVELHGLDERREGRLLLADEAGRALHLEEPGVPLPIDEHDQGAQPGAGQVEVLAGRAADRDGAELHLVQVGAGQVSKPDLAAPAVDVAQQPAGHGPGQGGDVDVGRLVAGGNLERGLDDGAGGLDLAPAFGGLPGDALEGAARAGRGPAGAGAGHVDQGGLDVPDLDLARDPGQLVGADGPQPQVEPAPAVDVGLDLRRLGAELADRQFGPAGLRLEGGEAGRGPLLLSPALGQGPGDGVVALL